MAVEMFGYVTAVTDDSDQTAAGKISSFSVVSPQTTVAIGTL